MAGETDITNNVYAYAFVALTIPGDVDGGFNVDTFDVVRITSAYGKSLGDPLYNPTLTSTATESSAFPT